jgi:hypothetical protein
MKREGIMAEALLICVMWGYVAIFFTAQPAGLRAVQAVGSLLWAFIAGRRGQRDWDAVSGKNQP